MKAALVVLVLVPIGCARVGDVGAVAPGQGGLDVGVSGGVAHAPDGEVPGGATPDAAGAVGPANPGGDVVVDNAAVEPNLASSLSCIVTWTTTEPATSEVRFSAPGHGVFRVGDDALVTEHHVVVIGMRADTDYHLRVVSTTGAGRIVVSNPFPFRTGPLPPEVPMGTVTVAQKDRLQPGWILTMPAPALAPTGGVGAAVMYDRDGFPVWYYRLEGQNSCGYATLVDGGQRILVVGGSSAPVEVDLSGKPVFWPIVKLTSNGGFSSCSALDDGSVHHEFRKLADGNYALLRYAIQGGAVGDLLQVADHQGKLLWQWNVFDQLTPSPGQWTHGNALYVDPVERAAYYSARNLSTIFKIDQDTGEILWRLGPGGTFAPDPGATHPWPTFQHDPTPLPGGDLLVHDNGDEERGYSRAVRYRLDLDAMRAYIVWEYSGATEDERWFAAGPGSAALLPNGSYLIAATIGSIFHFELVRIFEVTPQGERVWHMELPQRLVFRASRVPAFAEPLPE